MCLVAAPTVGPQRLVWHDPARRGIAGGNCLQVFLRVFLRVFIGLADRGGGGDDQSARLSG